MTEFIILSFASFISIISLGKIINYNQRYDYFISTIVLTFISYLCLSLNINLALSFLKIILIIIFFYLLLRKKIKIENFDYLLLTCFVFLLYFNYNDIFVKSDIHNGYGYLIKVIFLNSNFPQYDNITNYTNFRLDLLHSIYFNYFLAGSSNFREDVVILSQNLFLIFASAVLLKSSDVKGKKSLTNLIKFFLIIYLLIGIFLQNGKNIFAEDFLIFFIFGISIFLIENSKKIKPKIFLFLIISFFLIGLGKKSALFLIIFPFAILFFNSIKLQKKIFQLSILTITIIISLVFNSNLNSDNQNKAQNKHSYLIQSIDDFDGYTEKDFNNYKNLKFTNLFIPKFIFNTDSNYLNIFKKFNMRYNFYQTEKDFFQEKFQVISDSVFNTEIYKASLLPVVRFIVNKNNLNFKFPRISIILYYWIIFIIFIFYYIDYNSKKIFKRNKYNKKFLILLLGIILINVIIVIEDAFMHNEVINFESNIYSFKTIYQARDQSRYLGWSILFSILFSLYLAKKTNKLNYPKFLNIILIVLLIISPARSFGHLIKLDKYKEANDKLKKQYKSFSPKFENSCNKNNQILIFDNDSTKLSFIKFTYTFYAHKFIQIDIGKNKNNYKFIEDIERRIFSKKDIIKNFECIVVPKNSKLGNMIEKFSTDKFDVTPLNPNKFDFTVYKIF